MSREAMFIEAVKRRYEREGWKALSAEKVKQEIGFTPDLVMQRGKEHLVIDVKETGYSESRSLKIIRKMVEAREGWHFEVKVVPPSWGQENGERMPDDVRQRIELSRKLSSEGYQKEAFILVWTSLEALLREKVQADDDKFLPLTDLIRQAYEDGIIRALQLPHLRRMQYIRNNLLHGVSVEVSMSDIDTIFSLVETVLAQTQTFDQNLQP